MLSTNIQSLWNLMVTLWVFYFLLKWKILMYCSLFWFFFCSWYILIPFSVLFLICNNILTYCLYLLQIDAEFSRMFPDCGTLLGKFPSFYTPRIIKYCQEKRIDIYERYEGVLDGNYYKLIVSEYKNFHYSWL